MPSNKMSNKNEFPVDAMKIRRHHVGTSTAVFGQYVQSQTAGPSSSSTALLSPFLETNPDSEGLNVSLEVLLAKV